MSYTATTENVATTSEAAFSTTVNQQTSSADRETSSVTDDDATVTDSLTQTGTQRHLAFPLCASMLLLLLLLLRMNVIAQHYSRYTSRLRLQQKAAGK